MIKEKRASGLLLYMFFEHSRFPFIMTVWLKKFPWIKFAFCDKKTQKWYPDSLYRVKPPK